MAIAQGLSKRECPHPGAGILNDLNAWFRNAARMPPIDLNPPSGRFMSFSEREEIAILWRGILGVPVARRSLVWFRSIAVRQSRTEQTRSNR